MIITKGASAAFARPRAASRLYAAKHPEGEPLGLVLESGVGLEEKVMGEAGSAAQSTGLRPWVGSIR